MRKDMFNALIEDEEELIERRASNLKLLDQTGKKPDIPRDRGRIAKLPGKRISKTGKIYWETRRNRSDAPLSKV